MGEEKVIVGMHHRKSQMLFGSFPSGSMEINDHWEYMIKQIKEITITKDYISDSPYAIVDKNAPADTGATWV